MMGLPCVPSQSTGKPEGWRLACYKTSYLRSIPAGRTVRMSREGGLACHVGPWQIHELGSPALHELNGLDPRVALDWFHYGT